MKLQFTCNDCGRRQSMIVRSVCVFFNKDEKKMSDIALYENEIRCKSCGSINMKGDHLGLAAATIRKAFQLDHDEITFSNGTVIMENKPMPFSEAKPYIERRIQEEPQNGELRLRYANHLRKLNTYDKAITQYEESLRLNGNLIASLINLCDIYLYRNKEYKERGALPKARDYYERAVNLYHSGSAFFTTIENKKKVPIWIIDRGETLKSGRKKKRR